MSAKFVLAALLLMFCCSLPPIVAAQSEQQGIAVFKEAEALQEKAQSRQDLEKALEKYFEALSIFEKSGSEKGQGVTLNNIATVYHSLGQYQKVLEYGEKSLVFRRKSGDAEGEGVTLRTMGAACYSLGQYYRALDYYTKTMDIARSTKDLQGEGVTWHNMAAVALALGDFEYAVKWNVQSLTVLRHIGNLTHEDAILNDIASAYFYLGQYQKALEYFHMALATSRKVEISMSGAVGPKVGGIGGEGAILNNMAQVYVDWGWYQKAVEYLELSLAIRRKMGDPQGESVTLANLGSIYSSLGQYNKALEFYENSLAIKRKLGDLPGESLTLHNVASVYESLGEYQKALDYHEKALEIRKRIRVPYVFVEDSIGNVYLSMGDIGKAEEILKRTNLLASLGRLALVKSDFSEASAQYRELLNRSQQTRGSAGLFTAHTGLGLANEGLQNYEAAAEHFRQAIQVAEDIRSSLSEAQKANFYDVQIWHIPRITPYEGLSRVMLKIEKPDQSLKNAEATRARAFSESLSKRPPAPQTQRDKFVDEICSELGICAEPEETVVAVSLDVPRDVADQDMGINNKIAGLLKGRARAYEQGSTDAINSFEKQVKQARTELDAHIDKMRKEYPLFAATKYPQPMDLSQSALKDNEWVLEYEVTDSGICTYLIHGKAMAKALFKPIPRKEIETLVRKFREPLEITPGKDKIIDKLKSFDIASGQKLAEILLSDVLADLPKGVPVIVIPDESLATVPFEMLILGAGGEIKTDRKIPYVTGAEFFGDRNLVSYYQSLTALTLARTLGTKGRGYDRLLVIADPVFQMTDKRAQQAPSEKVTSPEKKFIVELMVANEEAGGGLRFKRLDLTSELADHLKSMFAENSDLYTGLDASKGNLLSAIAPNLTQYRTVVFATHGYFDKDNPGIMEPILALTTVPPGTDGFLRMSEVMGLKLNADMVALTACQTGLGKTISGEGTMGMGRAFQYAGASSVLMSLWSVSERSSIQLVESFFQHIKAGKNKLEALRMARDEVRKQGFDHPFFWASFILVGEVE